MLAFLAGFFLQGDVDHSFTFVAEQDLKSVSVAGTFNGWNKDARHLAKQSDGRTWKTSVRISPGKHAYKFVLNGENWITDPKSKRNEDDGNGNINSILIILPPGYEATAATNDGTITLASLAHSGGVPDLNWDRGGLTLQLRARPNDIARISAVINGKSVLMQSDAGDELYATYVCTVPWDRKKKLSYYFLLNDGGKTKYYGKSGVADEPKQAFELDSKSYRHFAVPQWVEQTVFYQIFPDRFENGSVSNDPKEVMSWNADPKWFNRFGGDAAGVMKRLGHLRALGVTGVYFNPIFKSPSNHRYDATDYLQIDPEFGTNDEFIRLTKALTAIGIRTVLDGVFNHTATDFWAFADIVSKGESSPYKNWYTIKSFPVVVKDPPNYEAWFGYAAMPKLNLANSDTQKYMLSIPDFWMSKADISGWRLDVANEVPDWFWRLFRNKVKSRDQQNWIVGEVWGDGSRWLKGDQWDSVMNYQFRDAVLGFTGQGKTTPTQFANRLMQVYRQNVPQVSRNMMNLLGSHDTPRILTLCNDDRELAKLAAVIQFGWVGSPSIYYGDELGMQGGPDPDNRRGMQWSLAVQANDIHRLYQKLVRARLNCPALMSGDPVVVRTDDEARTLVLGRIMPDGSPPAALVINRSDVEQTVFVPASVSGHKFVNPADLAGTARVVRQEPSGFRIVLAPKSAALFGSAKSGKSLPASIGAKRSQFYRVNNRKPS